MNTKDDDTFSPIGAPTLDDELGVDSSVGITHSESYGDEYVSLMSDHGKNIYPEGVIPPNNSPIGDNTQDGSDTPRKH